MAYPLSATRLNLYQRCPQSYYFRYERGLKEQSAFGSPALGKAVHAALKDIYGDWNYGHPKPSLNWFELTWQSHTGDLSNKQIDEGWLMLKQYFEHFIEPYPSMSKPLGVEQVIKGKFQVQCIEFVVRGQYDRLDYIENGLELIDYKSTKLVNPPDAVDIQLGLYDLLLKQTYQQALQRLSLIYLRTGEKVTYEVTPEHRKESQRLIEKLAVSLQREEQWQPQAGEQCDRCSYQRYCAVKTEQPEPLPEGAKQPRGVQLMLPLG
jgi:putative RecB family exonuclease